MTRLLRVQSVSTDTAIEILFTWPKWRRITKSDYKRLCWHVLHPIEAMHFLPMAWTSLSKKLIYFIHCFWVYRIVIILNRKLFISIPKCKSKLFCRNSSFSFHQQLYAFCFAYYHEKNLTHKNFVHDFILFFFSTSLLYN